MVCSGSPLSRFTEGRHADVARRGRVVTEEVYAQASTRQEGVPARRAHDLGGGRRKRKGAHALVAFWSSILFSYARRAAVLPESVTIWKVVYRYQDAIL